MNTEKEITVRSQRMQKQDTPIRNMRAGIIFFRKIRFNKWDTSQYLSKEIGVRYVHRIGFEIMLWNVYLQWTWYEVRSN